MPKLIIDNQVIDVPAGTTLLAAARQAGIDIPALCAIDGLEPLTSCFVCVVQVNRRDRLLPSCATLAEDGMVVQTTSPAVLAARKTAVELLLSDHLGECEAPCQISCPAGLHVPRLMDHLVQGDFASAAAIAAQDLVLPAVLGRICPRFCENTCRRQERDKAVAIADVHRQVAERGISMAGQQASTRPAKAADLANDVLPRQVMATSTGKSVAIVGAGPAGLAAAAGLLARGHGCVLFDSAEAPGGMLLGGFDEAHLPRIVVDAEIDAIRRLGGEFRMKTTLGRDISLKQLRVEFDAVLLATGAPLWQKLDCEGGSLAISAGEVMAGMRPGGAGEPIDLECDVIVVGAGQEALTAAMAVCRRKASSVIVVSPRPPSGLLERATKQAQASGVRFAFETRVVEVRKPAMRLYMVVEGKAGRTKLDCNVLINAMGREVDLESLSEHGAAVGPRGIKVDRATHATSLPGVFAAGEAVSGAGFAVRAIASGLAAAESIDQHLSGRPLAGPPRPHTVRYGKLGDEEKATLLARSKSGAGRHARIFDDSALRAEAERCLLCGCADNHLCRLRQAATAVAIDSGKFKGERRALELDGSHPLIDYESGKCIMCGACVRICEQAGEDARPLDQATEEDRLETCPTVGLTCIGRGFNVRVAAPWGGKLAAVLTDELARRCAEACPTSAIVLKTAAK